MGVCKDCIYIGDKIRDCRRNPHLRHENFACLNLNNAETDFITGQIKNGSCRFHNMFGECLFFDDGSVPFYAWKCNADLVYTYSDTPASDEKYYNLSAEELGEITSIKSYYAWSDENTTVYTLSETPLVDYDVFDASGNSVGVITEVDDNIIKIDDAEYTRNSDNDKPYAAVVIETSSYFRSEDDDIKVIPINSDEEEIVTP